MGRVNLTAGLAALLLLFGTAQAQSNVTATRIATTATAESQSHKLEVPGNGGCITYDYDPNGRTSFNYSAFIGLPEAGLPAGCTADDLKVSRAYAEGACADSRENNYPVAGLGASNGGCTNVAAADTNTCLAVQNQADKGNILTGLQASDPVDAGRICWTASNLRFFIQNNCASAQTATIKITFDNYSGKCTKTGAYSGSIAGGSTGSSSKKLSSGAIAGIVIGVIAGIALIAVASWFFCCQLTKQ